MWFGEELVFQRRELQTLGGVDTTPNTLNNWINAQA